MSCELQSWQFQKVWTQAAKFANDIANAAPGNQQQLEDRWLDYLDQWAVAWGCETREALVEAARLPEQSPHLPDPT